MLDKIKETVRRFLKQPVVRRQNTEQEMLDLAENYKLMISSPAWQDYENKLKMIFNNLETELEKDNLKNGVSAKEDYYLIKMAQGKKNIIKDILYIPFLVLGRAEEIKEKTKKKGESNVKTNK